MVLVVYGSDAIRAQEKVSELELAFKKKFDPTGLNVDRFPRAGGEKFKMSEALTAITSLPFLSPRRMVILKNAFGDAKKDAAEKILEALRRTPESTIAIVWEDADVDAFEKKPACKELKTWTDIHFYPFRVPEGIALETWVKERIQKLNASIKPDATRELCTRAGDDIVRLTNEIDKLVAYANDAPIDRASVELLVRPSATSDTFAFMDALASNRKGEAVEALMQERDAGSNAYYLLTMLTRQIRLLLSVCSLFDEQPGASKADVAEALGVHPFVAQKLLAHAKKYSTAELKRLHEDAFHFDRETKRGGMEPDAAVELLVTGLIR